MSDLSSAPSSPAAASATSPDVALRIYRRIADEIACKPDQVNATVQLLDEGSTVPFIAQVCVPEAGSPSKTCLAIKGIIWPRPKTVERTV